MRAPTAVTTATVAANCTYLEELVLQQLCCSWAHVGVLLQAPRNDVAHVLRERTTQHEHKQKNAVSQHDGAHVLHGRSMNTNRTRQVAEAEQELVEQQAGPTGSTGGGRWPHAHVNAVCACCTVWKSLIETGPGEVLPCSVQHHTFEK